MPWYTTADARRDAEKQAAIKNLENSVRNNEGPTMNDMEREYRQLCRIDENPGVQGLAQLGRNAIERVSQLEKDLAAAVAERDATRRHAQDLTECAMKTIPADWRPCYAWTDDSVMNVLAEYVIELRNRAEKAEARLAAIYGAPAIARIESLPGPRGGAYLYIMGVESPPNVSSGTDLIARPAKD